MRQRGDRVAAALCGVGAVVLLVSTFLGWYPVAVEGAYFNRSIGVPAFAGREIWLNAWEAFEVVDLVLALAVAIGAWAAAALVRGRHGSRAAQR